MPEHVAGNAPRFVLTMDTDWAPQFVLDHVLDMLRTYNAPATLFCTSAYDLPADMLANGTLEIGLHPNFMPGSTQGPPDAGEEGRLRHLLDLYPDAIGSRSHRFYWHSGLRALLLRNGLRYDASIFCPLQSHLHEYDYYGLTRFPTWWADGYHLLQGLELDRFAPPGMHEPGLKILNVHPIHVYCNTNDLGRMKKSLAGVRLPEAEPNDLAPLRSRGAGVETLFLSALRMMADQDEPAILRALRPRPLV